VSACVNSSLYYIYSAVREDWPLGVSPGGLATNSYDGRSFWDCETWMFPPVSLLRPRLGQSLLQYRLDRLEPAQVLPQVGA
jgi:trehalose/maltose hydrolase-like predicted phosphorylase